MAVWDDWLHDCLITHGGAVFAHFGGAPIGAGLRVAHDRLVAAEAAVAGLELVTAAREFVADRARNAALDLQRADALALLTGRLGAVVVAEASGVARLLNVEA